MAKSTCEAAKRLIKCFCGCGDMTEEEVKRIYMLNCGETLIDRQAAKMLRAFLKQQQSGDESECEQYLNVYEKCTSYLLQTNGVLTLDELEELADLGLKRSLEKDLQNQIQTGDASNIARCLMRIQGECRNDIQASPEFKAFKEALLKKWKQRPTC